MLGSCGSMAIESKLRRSSCFSGEMRAQCFPESSERYTPSVAPATRMSGLEGACGNGADYESFKTNELPGVAGVGAAVNASAVGAKRPARGIKCVCRARIHDHGHDHVIVMLADSSEQVPVFSRHRGSRTHARLKCRGRACARCRAQPRETVRLRQEVPLAARFGRWPKMKTGALTRKEIQTDDTPHA